jgi:hypothetical protein
VLFGFDSSKLLAALISVSSLARWELYISHKSTYGQRYLPTPPGPLSRTAGEEVNVEVLCS